MKKSKNDEANPKIRDIPSIQNGLKQIRQIKVLKTTMLMLLPILRTFGVDTKSIDEALSRTNDMERIIQELADLPDRFNDLFATRGWIIYDSLDLDLVRNAISVAEDDNLDQAEKIIANYYSAEQVGRLLRLMQGVKAFRPQMDLAKKALIDYQEERYHACVPVVLALTDGMVNELSENRKGFFADGIELKAWDSVSAHSKGLQQLIRIMTRTRQNTVTNQITIPFRNGILHGTDLGYDNKIVAAKSWAALFAVRDWAIKSERGLLTRPESKPKPGILEIIGKVRESNRRYRK